MSNITENTNKYYLKKQAVFDALYNCCEVNENDEVSLKSVLFYVSKEIDSRFINSEPLIELKQKLKDQGRNGWLPFEDVCTIFGAWMDIVSDKSKNGLSTQSPSKSDKIEFSPEFSYISPALPSVKKTIFNGLLNDKYCVSEELLSKCENCGKDENCCEWRNNEISREEKLTRCYEQKVTELQNLLRQSEDCNSLMQLENESLHQNCAVLQSKEQRWIEKEEELKELEAHLTSTNTTLNEQITCNQNEIQLLKQQLDRIKNENEKLVAQNQRIEELVIEKNKLEKFLNETKKAKQSEMELELQSKDIALSDLELKLDNLQQHIKVLQQRIAELEAKKCEVFPANDNLEQSIGEEIAETCADNELSFQFSDSDNLVAQEISTLKEELDACWGQYPLSCEHVSTQTSPNVSSTGIQTDFLKETICSDNVEREIADLVPNLEKKVVSVKEQYCKWTGTNNPPIVSNAKVNSQLLSSFNNSTADLNASVQTSLKENDDMTIPISSVTQSSLYIPVLHSNRHPKKSVCISSYEMELFLVVDATTQTDLIKGEGGGNKSVLEKNLLTSKKEQNIRIFIYYCCLVFIPSLHWTTFAKAEQYFGCFGGIILLINYLPASHPIFGNSVSKSFTLIRTYIINLQALMNIVQKTYQSSAITVLSGNPIQPSINFSHEVNNILLQQRTNVALPQVSWRPDQKISDRRIFPFDSRSIAVNGRCHRVKPVDLTMEVVSPPLTYYILYRIFYILIVLILWWVFQTWLQSVDDYNWYCESPFWSELHRVLAPKLELQWPNGPPPQ